MLYDYVKQKHISIDPKDRPGTIRPQTTKIVMHYTANPGATDEGHYVYYETGNDRYASAHIFVDSDSALELVPLNEIAYHASVANSYSIGIELCIEKDGSFHPNTIARAVKIVGELCTIYKLHPTLDVIRHYDVTGKLCPKLWVEKPNLFYNFKADVLNYVTSEVEIVMRKEDVDYILSVLSYYWVEMQGNVPIQEETHRIANELRVAVGRKPE